MKVDYHVHTFMCGHARGSMEELVESAIAKGFSEIGIADHMPLLYTDDRSLSMDPEELPSYVDRVLELKERFRDRIKVELGIEADYHPPTMDGVERMIRAHPFDFVIGSVHAMGDWIFDDPRHRDRYAEIDLDTFFVEYLEAERDMVSTGLYDIIGHADLVKKFGMRATLDLTSHYRELLLATREAGACFEVNTAGLRWPANEIYPEPGFVRLGADLGVAVTIGSDSHCPEDVGRDFDRAAELVRDSGYREIATFEGRAMRLVPLS